MKRKIGAIIKIIFSGSYLLVTRKPTGLLSYDYTFTGDEVQRYSFFIYGFLHDSDAALKEAENILKNK